MPPLKTALHALAPAAAILVVASLARAHPFRTAQVVAALAGRSSQAPLSRGQNGSQRDSWRATAKLSGLSVKRPPRNQVTYSADVVVVDGKSRRTLTLPRAGADIAAVIGRRADADGNRWVTQLDARVRPEKHLLIIEAPHGSDRVPLSRQTLAELGLDSCEVKGAADRCTRELTVEAHRRLGVPAILARYSKTVTNLNRAVGHPASGAYGAEDRSFLSNSGAYQEMFKSLTSILTSTQFSDGSGRLRPGKTALLLSLHGMSDESAAYIAGEVQKAYAADPADARRTASPLRPGEHVDVEIGTRSGKLCSLRTAQAIKAAFEREGLRVAIDAAFVGDESRETVRATVGQGFQAVQLEISHHVRTHEPKAVLRALTSFQQSWGT